MADLGPPQRPACPCSDAIFAALPPNPHLTTQEDSLSSLSPSFISPRLTVDSRVFVFPLVPPHGRASSSLCHSIVPWVPSRPLSCYPGTFVFRGVHTNFYDCVFASAEAPVRKGQQGRLCPPVFANVFKPGWLRPESRILKASLSLAALQSPDMQAALGSLSTTLRCLCLAFPPGISQCPGTRGLL